MDRSDRNERSAALDERDAWKSARAAVAEASAEVAGAEASTRPRSTGWVGPLPGDPGRIRVGPPPPRRPPTAERIAVAAITVAVVALVAGLLAVARPADEPSAPTLTTRPHVFSITTETDPLEVLRAPADARPLRLGLDRPGAELVSAQNLVDPNDHATFPLARPPWESPSIGHTGYRAGDGLAAPTFYLAQVDARLPAASRDGPPAGVAATDLGGVEVWPDPTGPAGAWVQRWTVRRPDGVTTLAGHGLTDAQVVDIARRIRLDSGGVPIVDLPGFDRIDIGETLPPNEGYGRSTWRFAGGEAEVGATPATAPTVEAMAAEAVTGPAAGTLEPVAVRGRDGLATVLPDGSWWVRWDEPDARAIGELVVRGDRAALDAALASVREIDPAAYLWLAASHPPDPAQRWSCPADPAGCRAAAVERFHTLDLLSIWRKGPTGLEGFGPVPGLPAPPDQYRGIAA